MQNKSLSCGVRFIALIIGIICALLFVPYHKWASKNVFSGSDRAQEYTALTDPTGFGPAYPAYWKEQNFWVGESCPVGDEVKMEAEKLLAPLDADHISQTAIVCMPAGQVSQSDVWTKRFSKFYGVGLAEGARRDNGFVWLLEYDQTGKVQVTMAIGDGLDALNPYELGNVKRAVEDSSRPEVSPLDNLSTAILTTAKLYEQVARSNYQPFEPTEVVYGGPIVKSEDDALIQLIILAICAGIWLTLLTEPFLAIAVLFGSYRAWQIMDWPIELAVAIAKSKSSGISTPGYRTPSTTHQSPGKVLGGSQNTTRTRK